MSKRITRLCVHIRREERDIVHNFILRFYLEVYYSRSFAKDNGETAREGFLDCSGGAYIDCTARDTQSDSNDDLLMRDSCEVQTEHPQERAGSVFLPAASFAAVFFYKGFVLLTDTGARAAYMYVYKLKQKKTLL